jgi:DNA-binding PadR family transcriptional regulator
VGRIQAKNFSGDKRSTEQADRKGAASKPTHHLFLCSVEESGHHARQLNQGHSFDYSDFRNMMNRTANGERRTANGERRSTMASKRLGRTQDATILVLTSLSGGPKHGYAVIKDIEAMAGVSYGPGTLYGVLARLEEEGLVEGLPSDDHRRPYRITGLGAAVLRDRLEANVNVAKVGFKRLGVLGA